MVRDRRRSLHREFVAAHPDWPVIPMASVVERMVVERSPVTAFAASSLATSAINALWIQVERRLIAMPPSKEQVARKLARIPSGD